MGNTTTIRLKTICKLYKLNLKELVLLLEYLGYHIKSNPNERVSIEAIDSLNHYCKLKFDSSTVYEEEMKDKHKSKSWPVMKTAKHFSSTPESVLALLISAGFNNISVTSRLTDEQYDYVKSHKKQLERTDLSTIDLLLSPDRCEYVGVVKFYDSWKNNFGYLGTNTLLDGFNLNIESVGYISLRFDGTDIVGPNPTDGSWVIFSKGNNKGRIRSASSVRLITQGKFTDLDIVLRYIGPFSAISGDVGTYNVIDSTIKYFDSENVVEKFLSIIQNGMNNEAELNKYLFKYFAVPNLRKVIVNKVTDKEFVSNVSASDRRYYHKLSESLAEYSVEQRDWATLIALRDSSLRIDFLYEKIKKSVVESFVLDKSNAILLIKRLGVEECRKLFSPSDPLIKTPELRAYLSVVLEDERWVNSFQNEDWRKALFWIESNCPENRTAFIKLFYKGKDESFVKLHPLADFDDVSKVRGLSNALFLDSGCYPGLFTELAECSASNNLPDVIPFLLSGNCCSSSLLIKIIDLLAKGGAEPSEVDLFVSRLWATKDGQEIILELSKLSNSDWINATFYAITQETVFLESIIDYNALISWVLYSDSDMCRRFIENYAEIQGSRLDGDVLLQSITKERLYSILESCKNDDEKLQLLDIVPQNVAKEVVTSRYSETNIYLIFIKKCWDEERSKVPYVVFDLEIDGDEISEFAFKVEGSMRNYNGEEQLKSLGRRLKKQKIIVGHNIKAWSLPLLRKKGVSTDNFIWDTLEVELLLEPIRYAYSLHISHNVEEDTELIDSLFWNQLYRLSLDKGLSEELAPLLPDEIKSILDSLREPCFERYFRDSANFGKQFFQTLNDMDENMACQLMRIQNELSENNVMIVSPHSLWGRIGKYITLYFPSGDKNPNTEILSISKITSYLCNDLLKQTILKRFVNNFKTPIISSLAVYIRMNFFEENELYELCENRTGGALCIDIDEYGKVNPNISFDKIYFIGCELGERTHQYKISEKFNISFFLERGCWTPISLSVSPFVALTKEDLELIHIKSIPSDVANVWVEKGDGNELHISYNYDYNKRRKAFVAQYPSAKVVNLDWVQKLDKEKKDELIIVKSQNVQKFDSKARRISSTARYKAKYWAYQFRLLESLRNVFTEKSFIYAVDNDAQIDELNEYSRVMGWKPANGGTILEKLESIKKCSNAIYIIHQADFKHIIDCREDFPYCFVWDNMSVDKNQIMWANQMPFGGEANYTSEWESHNSSLRYDVTAKSCLLASWPIYQYYAKLINANCPSSVLCVMDPYFDDYNDLSTVWNVNECSAALWSTEKEYEDAVSKCSEYVTDTINNMSVCWNERQIHDAMEMIRKIFLPKYEWRDYQLSTLPKILSKKKDYLVSIPTGGGKSVLFQGPALYNSMFSHRLSIVISPLKALMEDQIQGLYSKGFRINVDYINGDRPYQEIQRIYRKISGGELSLLYITPERFRSKAFVNALMNRIANDNGLEYFIFDEAHCISQWGHEFRPEYLNVIKWCKGIKESYPSTCVTFYSATVTKQIELEIKNYLKDLDRCGQSIDDYNPIRDHIGIEFIPVDHDDEARTDAVIRYIESRSINTSTSRILIFCRTRKQCEDTALKLRTYFSSERNSTIDGNSIGYFHSGMVPEDRVEAYEKYKSGDFSILCATKAFGMGMDISNIHYILHFSPPAVLEDYLQEVGRAGRNKEEYIAAGFGDNSPIPTVCLSSKEDFKKLKELLIRGMLTWTNIIEINQSIQSYITNIQSIETAKSKPVVIPFNLWKKDDLKEDHTAFRLGLYWLEQLNRYRLGSLCPAHINVSLLSGFLTKEDAILRMADKNLLAVYNYIKTVADENTNPSFQLPLNDARTKLRIGSNVLMDSLLLCVKEGIIEINQSACCRITKTRIDEVKYVFNIGDEQLLFALHIFFDMARGILSECELYENRQIESSLLQSILKESFTNYNIRTISVERETKDGVSEKVEYMPWYSKERKTNGLCLAESYKNDFIHKRARHVFTLIGLIPNVVLKTMNEQKKVKYQILLESEGWKSYLDSVEKDTLRLLRYIFDKQVESSEQSGEYSLNWPQAIIDLGLEVAGYQYFYDILLILKVLGYVFVESLLPVGIEVYTTNDTSDPILEKPDKGTADATLKNDFDESVKMKKIRLAVMDAFSSLKKEDYSQFITNYFRCKSNEDFMALLSSHVDENSDFMKALREDAILKEEERLGDEQRKIYDAPVSSSLNVKAGPGSGKTHILTLRCAKLIYQYGVDPSDILVLAYNRAVVVELKKRLEKLFGDLGLSRSASKLHVYTFHQMAKRYCGSLLDGKEFKEWELVFLNYIKTHPGDFKLNIGNLKFVLVDEFQDITQTRLDTLNEFRSIFKTLTFFTIGDPDQSIYGFDKKIVNIPQSTNPEYYYKQLDLMIHPTLYTMTTNYRSYPDILKAAGAFLPLTSKAPVSCERLCNEAPASDYMFSIDNCVKGTPAWFTEFPQVIDYAKGQGFRDVAVFLRSNNEVFRGYAQIKAMNLRDVRIRIQGSSSSELYRIREVYSVVNYLLNNQNSVVNLSMNKTKDDIKLFISDQMLNHQSWDRLYLDVVYTLILDFLDSISSEDTQYVYGDIAKYVIEMLQVDDGQIFKIYDRYKSERIEQGEKLNIVLTTMHKVKGLEFDAVVITPSFASLPFGNRLEGISDFLTDEEKEDFEEEKRLMYVAYTRAKKYLRVYTWKRELALAGGVRFAGLDSQLGYHDDSGLEKLYLSFLAKEFIFSSNNYIENNVRKSDSVVLCPDRWNSGYEVRHNNVIIGKLAKNSRILRDAINGVEYKTTSVLPTLKGFFINDIFTWSYKDSLRSDAENNTYFAKDWCQKAIDKGYIYVVDIAGYGKNI